MEINIQRASELKAKPDISKVPFGSCFSDHMFIMDWDKESGWHDARIVPYGPLQIMPCSTVIQYASEIFEGLKAYRCPDGSVQLFRPEENAKRMNNSAVRMDLPEIPVEDQVEAMRALVEIDKDWVPDDFGTSLYIRPFLFANDDNLSLHPYTRACYCIILSPVGSYFPDGLKPVPLILETEDVRAVRGGTGFAKCGGNYAGAMRAGARAESKGFAQVLWLDGVERKYIEEGGGMNVMFKINGKIVTPQLNGSVLPGITRKSAIQLFRDNGIEVDERLVSVDEIFEAAGDGSLEEAWMIGTAAVICPISGLTWNEKSITINNGEIGETTRWIYDAITDIQWGKADDSYGWCLKI